MTAVEGELLGTALLVLLGNGVVANVSLARTKGYAAGWIVITAGWGMAVFVGAACSATASGAHLNPAVTLGLLLAGRFEASLVPGYLAAQFVGAFLGALLVFLTYFPHYRASDDPAAKLGTFATGPAIRSPAWNLLCEVVGTLVLILAVLLMSDPELSLTVSSVPATTKLGLGSAGLIPIALVVFAIGMSLGGPTGYAINPARDLGPRVAHALLPIPGKGSSDWSYAWVPIVGPLLGAVLAAGIARALGAP